MIPTPTLEQRGNIISHGGDDIHHKDYASTCWKCLHVRLVTSEARIARLEEGMLRILSDWEKWDEASEETIQQAKELVEGLS